MRFTGTRIMVAGVWQVPSIQRSGRLWSTAVARPPTTALERYASSCCCSPAAHLSHFHQAQMRQRPSHCTRWDAMAMSVCIHDLNPRTYIPAVLAHAKDLRATAPLLASACLFLRRLPDSNQPFDTDLQSTHVSISHNVQDEEKVQKLTTQTPPSSAPKPP